MKKLFYLLLALIVFANSSSIAQETSSSNTETNTYLTHKPSFYIGARAGYLLTNNTALKSPVWHLKDGMFAELDFGYRNTFFGWQLSVGMHNIKRDVSQIGNFTIDEKMLYDSATAPNKPNVISGLNETQFTLTPNPSDISSKNLRSTYLLTGPEFWFGNDRLVGNLYLQGGLGFTKFGYYFFKGSGIKLEDTSIIVINDPRTDEPVEYRLSIVDPYNYSRYSMTAKTQAGSSLPTIKEQTEIHFMARVGLGLEYFVAPSFSVGIGASYWYIATPEMASKETFSGTLSLHNPAAPSYVSPSQYAKSFDKTNLDYLGISLGLKYWIGKANNAPEGGSGGGKGGNKDIVIVVKDRKTGLALSGVKVDVLQNGKSFTTGISNADGQIDKISNAAPARYDASGDKNNIKTTTAVITAEDFKQPGNVIYKEIFHDDPRFTLIGHTVNRKTKNPIPGINTILTNKANNATQQQISDGTGKFVYQLDANTDYTVVANSNGYFSNIEKVSTKGLDRGKTLYVELELGIDELTEGNTFEVKNILYDLDKAAIRPDAALVLDHVANMLKQNPSLRISLDAHTDSRNTAKYNQDLSQRRAQSAVDYLVRKGINRNRMVAKGYGESRLVNDCSDGVNCSEAEHQQNRRTEITILSR